MPHPNKDIRKAIEYAQAAGWIYRLARGGSHLKGYLVCPGESRDCTFSIYGTPRNPTSTAKSIRRAVARCPHDEPGE